MSHLNSANTMAKGRPDEKSGRFAGRLLSLDIFRGLLVAGMILVDNPGDDEHAFGLIKHAEWNGWTPPDFIFPSFLFIVGITTVFAVRSRLERGDTRRQILWHAFKRMLILIAVAHSRRPRPRPPSPSLTL